MNLKIAAIAALMAATLGSQIAPCTAQPPSTAMGGSLPAAQNPLHLTQNQQTAIKNREIKMQADVNALRSDSSMTDQQKQAKFIGMQQKFQADMLAILTPSQRATVAADAARRKAFADAQMKKILGVQTAFLGSLTKEQKAKIKSLTASLQQQAQSISQDSTLSNDQKRSRIAGLQSDSETQIKALLTPSQLVNFEKLEAMMPAPPMGARR